jgi:hypothetical protein
MYFPKIPERALVRIPGPPPVGSAKPEVNWCASTDPVAFPERGFADPGYYAAWQAGHGGAPVFWAISDGGMGWLPWGFWMVAIYPIWAPPVPMPSDDLAVQYLLYDSTSNPILFGSQVASAWGALRTRAVAAGFGAAADFDLIEYIPPVNIGTQLRVRGPYGSVLQIYYQGPDSSYPNAGNHVLTPGYDNPLWMGLWGPQRFVFMVTEPEPPNHYPYYPHEPTPPYGDFDMPR